MIYAILFCNNKKINIIHVKIQMTSDMFMEGKKCLQNTN